MIILNELPEHIQEHATVITIGTFDGIHKGHQKVLQQLLEIKTTHTLKSIVFTFYPHPRKIIPITTAQSHIQTLTSKNEKTELLKQYNIDYLIFCPFNEKFANILPEDFVKYLVSALNAKYIIIGYDHKFGKNREGSVETFLKLSKELNFQVIQIPAQTIQEINISSTKIRESLLLGNIQQANELLGYNYFITGTVVRGKQLGKTIGIPTANICLKDNDKLIPQKGVYNVQVEVDGKTYKGALNIGTNPTTDSDDKLKIEVHIIDFNKEIYDNDIKISFLNKIRDEQKFHSIQEMINQIQKDISLCK